MQVKKTNQITIKLDGQPLPTAKPSRLSIQETKPTPGVNEVTPLFVEPKAVHTSTQKPAHASTLKPDEDAMLRLSEIRQSQLERTVMLLPPSEWQDEQSHIPLFEGGEDGIDQSHSVWDEQEEPGKRRFASLFGRTSRLWKKPGMKMFLTVTGAVVVGLHFGFLVLAVFMNEQLSQSYRNVLDGTVQTLAVGHGNPREQGQKATAGTPDQKAAPLSNQVQPINQAVKVSLPEQRLFIAQGGVYSDQKAAEAAVKPLVDKQLPHMYYVNGDKRYLYLAAATSRDQILGLASQLKGVGLDVYVKEVTFPGINKTLSSTAAPVSASQAASASNQTEAQQFLSTGFALIRSLADWSGQMMRDGKAVKLPAADETKMTEQHRRLLDQKKAFEALLPETAKADLENMVNGVNQAVTAYAQVKNPNAESYAWQAQKGVLQFVESYMKIVRQIQP